MSAADVFRPGFGVLERVAPGVGAALGERICWRVDPSGSSGGDLPPGGDPLDVRVEGCPLAGRRWGTGDRPVLLAHGWSGGAAQMGVLVSALRSAGVPVVVWDQPGHGRSRLGRGRVSSVRMFTLALEAVVAAHGPARAVVTHSFASLALADALRRGLTAGRVALLAPTAGIADLVDLFVRMSGSGPRIRSRLVERMPRRAGVPAEVMELIAVPGAVTVPPTLVVHDVEDPWTPVSGGRAVAAAWPGSRLLETSGLGHYGILTDPDVTRAVVGHVDPVPAAPVSGAPGEAGR